MEVNINDTAQLTRMLDADKSFVVQKSIQLPAKILVVEDAAINQKIILFALSDTGYHVDVAVNGQQALDMCKHGYDLILLDIGLPDINGIEVCRQIRTQENSSRLPIIAVTSQGDSIKEECFAVGIDEVIKKPYSFEDLKDVIKAKLKESAAL